MVKLDLNKAIHTNKINRDEASEYFRFLKNFTFDKIKKEYNWYYRKGYWPIKAQVKNKAQDKPKFAVVHHTSNRDGNFEPALHRFFSARRASSNLLIVRMFFFWSDLKIWLFMSSIESGCRPI